MPLFSHKIKTMRLNSIKNTFNSILFSLLLLPQLSYATVVEVRTVLGDFQVNLFDETTPATVQNFLEYVNSGAYANNVVHRVEPNFVMQAGGFTYNGSTPLDNVTQGTPVTNEPELSNVRGTISMAKLSGNANSATSQWFINLANNSSNLDNQNGGFSAFGQVLGDGMDVVDAIAALTRFNLGGATNTIPLRDFTVTDLNNNTPITDTHLVIITDIVVVDATVVTNPTLNPTPNTLINPTPTPTPNPTPNTGGSGGGGSLHYLLLVGLIVICSRRKIIS